MENTPRSKGRQESPTKNGLKNECREVVNVLCNVDATLAELGISEEYRKLLKDAGLPVLCQVGRATIGLTGDLAKFLSDLPALPEPPSVARKVRYFKRKQKAK